ncbi:unnamed protein product [Rotaria magnacalcarata]|uniref:Hexosyltransferase n=1 Tax=Rotaria magnacalcarata TaxID=392030 RepID=A0A816UC99_9BILA|nr:unnamed protein product [Rotaria magnacalcarata]CAF2219592.1 unnamed protein product [Rotaria magnacalcarata]CAF2242209.1 unnamed protein product [Rotaria magnacalcarata]CAF3966429.1 unnamed protein product [Rotaria magnacalcarata]CAF4016566.1 unnamed protein product [Rotaria magnacalcarata]
MFDGYNGRRRLKNTLAIALGVVVLIALYYTPPVPPFPEEPIPQIYIPAPNPPSQSVVTEQRPGVLSNIEFINSPYLSLHLLPTNLIPIIVLSKAANIEIRDTIRRTWGFYRPYLNDTLRIKIFFLVGTDDFMIQRIRTEQIVFDDVIQVSIPDMYTFSAYKEFSAMLWVRNYLPDVPFYIKADDCLIINMRVLVDKFLSIMKPHLNKNVLIGWYDIDNTVQRGRFQKFPDSVMSSTEGELRFAMDLFYVVTAKSADRMLGTLSRIEQIDCPAEIFVTGILRDAANVDMTNIPIYAGNFKYEFSDGSCRDAFETDRNLLICTSSLHIGPIRSVSEYFDAWYAIIAPLPA